MPVASPSTRRRATVPTGPRQTCTIEARAGVMGRHPPLSVIRPDMLGFVERGLPGVPVADRFRPEWLVVTHPPKRSREAPRSGTPLTRGAAGRPLPGRVADRSEEGPS